MCDNPTMLQLYHGSGSTEIQLIRVEAASDEWLSLKDAAIRLLRARGDERAAELLYVFPWQVWEGTNGFNDEFYALNLPTTPEEYVRLQEVKALEQQQFRAIAEAVTEVTSFYIRFITVNIESRPRRDERGDSSPTLERPVAASLRPVGPVKDAMPATFDVAISFAGTERQHAQQLAIALRERGVSVFYDNFYADELWGQDLAAFFDDVFRKRARYCVMFVSGEYANRMWTTHERKSAMARAVADREREYILPIRVDDTDLPGLPPSIGYLSLADRSVTQIAELLVKKVRR